MLQFHLKTEYTANADAIGTLRMLDTIRNLKLEKRQNFIKHQLHRLYGKVAETPQTRKHHFTGVPME